MVKRFETRRVLWKDFGDWAALSIAFRSFLETVGSFGGAWKLCLSPWAALWSFVGSLVVLTCPWIVHGGPLEILGCPLGVFCGSLYVLGGS